MFQGEQQLGEALRSRAVVRPSIVELFTGWFPAHANVDLEALRQRPVSKQWFRVYVRGIPISEKYDLFYTTGCLGM